jgi:hypothetical protein
VAEEEILQANTDFGAQVIAARDKPTPEITIDNIPMDEFIRNEREGLNQPEQGTDIRGLFDEPEAAANLFRTPPPHSGPAPDIRANRAYSETLIFDDPASYDARKAQAQDGTVQDHALMGIREGNAPSEPPRGL